jgi:acylphosphatase
MTVCYRYIVKGRVQGVFFRGTTQREASKLGLTGYAKNLADGSVEVLVYGEESAVDALRDWLWLGPPAAKVTEVVCEPVSVEAPVDFQTR